MRPRLVLLLAPKSLLLVVDVARGWHVLRAALPPGIPHTRRSFDLVFWGYRRCWGPNHSITWVNDPIDQTVRGGEGEAEKKKAAGAYDSLRFLFRHHHYSAGKTSCRKRYLHFCEPSELTMAHTSSFFPTTTTTTFYERERECDSAVSAGEDNNTNRSIITFLMFVDNSNKATIGR